MFDRTASVRRASDNATANIGGLLSAGGYANAAEVPRAPGRQ
jgi:hypothetical protein